jgi:hypothetical protein
MGKWLIGRKFWVFAGFQQSYDVFFFARCREVPKPKAVID